MMVPGGRDFVDVAEAPRHLSPDITPEAAIPPRA